MRIALIDNDYQTHVHPEATEAVIEYGDTLVIVRPATEFFGLRIEIKGRIDLADNPVSIYDIPLRAALLPKGDQS